MAQLAAANVTYSQVAGTRLSTPADPRSSAVFNVSFGDGTATYTGGGIPLTKAKLGCPATIQEFYILSNGQSGYLMKYNYTAETLQLFMSDAHVHAFIMAGGVTTTADFLYHSSGAIGKAAANNVTIAGAAAPTTTGGVVGASAAVFGEVATTAVVSATTIQVRVVGW